MVDVEALAPAEVESPLKYHPCRHGYLTAVQQYPGPCVAGSLTGAVASQMVTEAREGWLRAVGNRSLSAMAEASLTARLTSRAESKDGHSDPVVPRGRAIAQRIKGTPGITG